MKCVAAIGLLGLVAFAAMGATEASPELRHESRGLRLISRILERDPAGFSITTGIGLGAEVDDIEAEVELGPFGFTLDPAPKKKEKKEKAASPPPEPACEKYCDLHTGAICCATAAGCISTLEVIPGCNLTPPSSSYYYTNSYGRK